MSLEGRKLEGTQKGQAGAFTPRRQHGGRGKGTERARRRFNGPSAEKTRQGTAEAEGAWGEKGGEAIPERFQAGQTRFEGGGLGGRGPGLLSDTGGGR